MKKWTERIRERNHELPSSLSFSHLRRYVGYTAIALPIVVSIGFAVWGGHRSYILDSISESYYTVMRDVFVGMLCAVGFFLIAYTGYNHEEEHLFNLCGVLALLIAAFPMNPRVGTDRNAPASPPACVAGADGQCRCQATSSGACSSEILMPTTIDKTDRFEVFVNNRRMLGHYKWFGWIHLTSASILFVLLGWISRNLFVLSDKKHIPEDSPKAVRNRIYRFCGTGIWVALGIYMVFSILPDSWKSAVGIQSLDACLLLLVEAVCLCLFGTSWLVKGDVSKSLRDKAPGGAAKSPREMAA